MDLARQDLPCRSYLTLSWKYQISVDHHYCRMHGSSMHDYVYGALALSRFFIKHAIPLLRTHL